MRDGFYKIKTWEQMEKENRLDSDGDIEFETMGHFTLLMERKMPFNRIVYLKNRLWDMYLIEPEMVKCYLGNSTDDLCEKDLKKSPDKETTFNPSSTFNLFNSKFVCSEEDKSGTAIFEEGKTKYEIYLKEYLDYFKFQDLLNKAVKYGRATMALEFKNKMEQTIVDIEKDI